MLSTRCAFTGIAFCLYCTICYSEEPSFPHPKKEDPFIPNQYIIQFKDTPAVEKASQSFVDRIEGVLLQKIRSRNILIAKFASTKKAQNFWKAHASRIRLFEQGEITQSS